MSKIISLSAEEILDSRGTPTLSVTVTTDSGSGTFAVPSGASTGSHEALEKRDGDAARFEGKGVLQAVAGINTEIAQALIGMDSINQRAIDDTMLTLDGTPNKSRLGGNALIGVSIAVAKAAAASQGKQVFEHLRTLGDVKPSRRVPFLYMNLVNGGLHAQSPLAFQEYHIVPQTDDVEESLNIGTTITHTLKKLIREQIGASSANIGDEGGFAPDIADVKKPLDLLMEAIEKAGFEGKVKLAMDVAASSFYENGKYKLEGKEVDAAEMAHTYRNMMQIYPILSIEDPYAEESFSDFAALTAIDKFIIVGDDLTVTNKERLQMAIDQKAISGIIIKPNQIGTLSETIDTMKLARENGIECIVSHRSGETNDDFIADLAYAFGAFGLKTGAPQRGERVAKYNRLRHIINLNT